MTKHRIQTLAVSGTLVLAATAHAQSISHHVVGNNLWLAVRENAAGTPSASVMNASAAAGIRFIRIGGNSFDNNTPSNAALLIWINRVRATGAEPLVQISRFQSPAQAAATVQFLNVTSGANITYWSIGNEPWLAENRTADPDLSEAQIAALVEGYFKPLATAMKSVDPAIKIYGVDSEDFQQGLHARLFGGSNNIAGKVPGEDYYYCDGLSWHRYPQATGIDPAKEGLTDIRQRIENCRALIDAVNLAEGRTGADTLQWAIGEFNSKNGAAVHTWGNGQMFAGVYGLAMKHGATHVAAWSLQESNGARTSSDFGLLDGEAQVPRPSYWHTQLVSKYFSGRYLEGTPSISSGTSDLLVFGAESTAGDVSVMIMNRGFAAAPYTLHLHRDAMFATAGSVALNVDAGRAGRHDDVIPARATHVLVFRRDSLLRAVYTNDDFIAEDPPQTAVLPRSPLRGVLDDFDRYADFAQQGYWDGLHLGNGTASIDGGKLVLRATDTAHASATVASPVGDEFNFFEHGIAITLDGFEQSTGGLAARDSQFRLCLNSTASRSFGADDSLVLRVDPQGVRFGYKVNQPGVQGELRAGTSTDDASLFDFDYSGTLDTIRLSLEAEDASNIRYHVQLDGSFGRIHRSGTFLTTRADWGNGGDSVLVLESRRNSALVGGAGSFSEACIDSVSLQPLVIDDFESAPDLTGQNYWLKLLSPADTPNSTVGVAGGSATLAARSNTFGSAALAGAALPELSFFQRGFTLDLEDLVLSSNNLAANESFFRLSLNSTPQRSFTTPDALTLRLTPTSARFGFKLDQPNADAELRTGTATTASALFDIALPGPATAVRLTVIPLAPAGTMFYAVRIITASGEEIRSGNFTAELSLWGAAGDSSLVLEARRASGVAGDLTSFSQAVIGAVRYTPLAEDFLSDAPSFDAWRLSQFASEELAEEVVSGPDATPAGDGVSNLLKYAFGLDAKVPAAPGFLPALGPVVGESPGFEHEERAGASDLLYQVEATPDLSNWAVPVVELSRSPVAAGWVSVTSRADLPVGSPRVFYRVRVSR